MPPRSAPETAAVLHPKPRAAVKRVLGVTCVDPETTGERAWAVTLDGNELLWTDGKRTYDTSPQATGGQKFQAWLAKVLPLDSQL